MFGANSSMADMAELYQDKSGGEVAQAACHFVLQPSCPLSLSPDLTSLLSLASFPFQVPSLFPLEFPPTQLASWSFVGAPPMGLTRSTNCQVKNGRSPSSAKVQRGERKSSALTCQVNQKS